MLLFFQWKTVILAVYHYILALILAYPVFVVRDEHRKHRWYSVPIIGRVPLTSCENTLILRTPQNIFLILCVIHHRLRESLLNLFYGSRKVQRNLKLFNLKLLFVTKKTWSLDSATQTGSGKTNPQINQWLCAHDCWSFYEVA